MPELLPQISPKPISNTLDFPAAIRALAEGRKITRLEWGNKSIYGWLDDTKVRIMLADGKHDWILSDGDLFADDWIVL